MGTRVGVAVVICAAFFSAGCGGSSGTGQLRFLQASPNAPGINLFIDGDQEGTNLAYTNTTGYISLHTGSRHVQAIPVNSSSPIFDAKISIGDSTNSTLLLTGTTSSLQQLLLSDGGTTALSGESYVRVVNASPSMGGADVYIVPAGGGISGAQPVATNVGFDGSSGYQAIVIGNYEVIITVTGIKSNVLLDTGSIALSASQNQTVVALDGTSGGFTFSLLQDQ